MIQKLPSWLIPLAIALVAFMYLSGSYNAIISRSESVEAQWGQVSNVYQRRADLIPNLVEVVKGYAKHEEQTLVEVISARAEATKTNINVGNMSQENLNKFDQAQTSLGGAVSKLLAVVEQYPNLKANENFIALQTQLEGTENRIANERRVFNEAVQSYNTYIKTFPQNLMASMFGFKSKPYFQSTKDAETAPQVKF